MVRHPRDQIARFRSLALRSSRLTRPLLAGATTHGENKAKMCEPLFTAYRECRKAEQKEIVRKRIENRKSMFFSVSERS